MKFQQNLFRLSIFFSLLLFASFSHASDVVIRIKVSAPKQDILMTVDFPRHTFGVGGELRFFVKISKDAGTAVTNIHILETVNFDDHSKTNLRGVEVDTGIPEMYIQQCSRKLMRPGLHEYRIRSEGVDSAGIPFTRSETRQIIVEDALDGSFVFTNEVGPFFLNSDNAILFREGEVQLDQFVLRPPLDRQMRDVMSLPSRYKILVEGHADQSTLGNVEANQVLSSNRAMRVREALIKVYGIPPERIVVRGMGERLRKYEDIPGTRLNRNRRVQVIFPYGQVLEE